MRNLFTNQAFSNNHLKYMLLILFILLLIGAAGYFSQDFNIIVISFLSSLKSIITIVIIILILVVLFMGYNVIKSMKRYFNLSEKAAPDWERELDDIVSKNINNESNFLSDEISPQGVENEPSKAEWKRTVSVMMTAVTPVKKPEELIRPILEVCPEDAREHLKRSWNSFFDSAFLYTDEFGKSRRYSTKSAWILFDDRFFDSAFQYKISFISIHRSFIKMAPGLMTSLGMLGTFLGISSGLGDLANFETLGSEEITQSMGRVIVGLTSAFWTSIAGLLGAMFFSMWATFVQSDVDRITARLVNCIEKALPPFNPERAQRDAAQSLRSVRDSLTGDDIQNKENLYQLLTTSNNNQKILTSILQETKEKDSQNNFNLHQLLIKSNQSQESMIKILQEMKFDSLDLGLQLKLFVSSCSEQHKNTMLALKNLGDNHNSSSSQLFNIINLLGNSIIGEIKSIRNQNQFNSNEMIKIIENIDKNQEYLGPVCKELTC